MKHYICELMTVEYPAMARIINGELSFGNTNFRRQAFTLSRSIHYSEMGAETSPLMPLEPQRAPSCRQKSAVI
jgi:hypothetical protein